MIYRHFFTYIFLVFPIIDNKIFITKEKISNNELNSSKG